MDKVIEVALADLSSRVNVGIELSSDPDRRAAVETLRILWRAGYVLRRLDIGHWAIAHGWEPLAALALGSIADAVNDGGTFHLLSKGPVYPDGILETWESAARR